jgi:hypothetical protein
MKSFRSSSDRARRNPHLLQVGTRWLRVVDRELQARIRMARTRSRLLRTVESGKPALLTVGAAPPLWLSA